MGKNIQGEAHSQCVFLPHDERPLEEIKAQEWKIVFPEEPRGPSGPSSHNKVGKALALIWTETGWDMLDLSMYHCP